MAQRNGILKLLTLMGFVLIVASGCGPGRKAQCQDLGNATNDVMGKVDAVYQSQIGGNAYDPEFEHKLADAWDAGAAIVGDVALSDKTLKTIRDDLVLAYQQAATMGRQAAELIPPSGRLSAEAEAQVDELHLESQASIPPAINALNLYCLGG